MQEIDTFAAYWKKLTEIVEEHGWAVQAVFEDQEQGTPGFAYTVGLASKGLPDMMTFALPQGSAQHILNAIVQKALSGDVQLQSGEILLEVANLPIKLQEMASPQEAFRFAKGAQRHAEEHGLQASILQVVWPDPQGRFPGEKACEPQTIALQDFSVIAGITIH